jgi:NAD(P)-dependent dehydrogenase (short-subunit alcohol dehydrogenase family)
MVFGALPAPFAQCEPAGSNQLGARDTMTIPFRINLKDQVAVVTGGGGILCSVMADALAQCGAKVAVLSLRPERALKAAEGIVKAGGVAKGFACNVLEKPSIEQAHEQIKAAFGPVDILINGAGGNHPKGTTSKEFLLREDLVEKKEGVVTFYDLTVEGVQSVFSLNFLGTFLATQVFSRDMVEKGRGNIINISSMSAFKPLTKVSAYSAAKAGVNNFTQWLAVYFSKTGVRVNAIAPGFFLGDQNRRMLMQPDGALTPRGNTIISHTPQGHFGKPEDLLGTLLWLLSDEGSGFVTGQVIAVDGGFSAYTGV